MFRDAHGARGFRCCTRFFYNVKGRAPLFFGSASSFWLSCCCHLREALSMVIMSISTQDPRVNSEFSVVLTVLVAFEVKFSLLHECLSQRTRTCPALRLSCCCHPEVYVLVAKTLLTKLLSMVTTSIPTQALNLRTVKLCAFCNAHGHCGFRSWIFVAPRVSFILPLGRVQWARKYTQFTIPHTSRSQG